MIDLKALRENPARFRDGAKKKNVPVDIDRIVDLDVKRRELLAHQESLRAEQNKLAKDSGPRMGQLSGQLKKASDAERPALQAELDQLRAAPAKLKAQITTLDDAIRPLDAQLDALLLAVPLPPDDDVPVGSSSDDNVEIRRWSPEVLPGHPGVGGGHTPFNPDLPFVQQLGFTPASHVDLMLRKGWVDFDRGIKIAGARSYILKGHGFRLHQAILRYAVDFMVERHGFTPLSVATLVREQAMIGTGFFPAGREQTYHIDETKRGGGYDMFLTGTGEVGLMGVHADEILDEASLPLKYVTVSTCYRREAGAAGKDTAGLYRIHQFDKAEQVVICRNDPAESRRWHTAMIGYVEELLQSLRLPHRLLQCCTGDLGVKNADMVDIECWMPSRGDPDATGLPRGNWGETHSASRLYDFQCRRLNMRYRPGGDSGTGPTTFCHSLNNTVAASPRILIPLIEMHQRADGSVWIPQPLRPYLGGEDTLA